MYCVWVKYEFPHCSMGTLQITGHSAGNDATKPNHDTSIHYNHPHPSLSMKLFSVAILCILTSYGTVAQIAEWAYTFGADNGSNYGRVVVEDGDGNIFVGGRIFDLANVDVTPPTVYFLNPNDYHAGFVAKYDENMDIIWARLLHGPEYQSVWDMAVDDTGNLYVTGSYKGSITFENNGTPYPTVGQADIFLAKYDPNGQLLWSHVFGSPGFDRGNCLAIDDQGDVYLAGYYSGNIDIDPGSGTTMLYNSGGYDAFLAKFTPQGQFIQRLYIGGLAFEEANGIGLDQDGNIYLTGTFGDGADFIVGTTDHILNTANIDIFIAKYDSTFQFQWAYDVGGGTQFGSNCQAHDIEVFSSGDFAISGIFWGTAQFDPINATALVTPNAGDMFIARYDQNGGFQWMKHVGLHQGATAYELDMDDSGNFYAAGSFYDSLDFDPGPGVDMIASAGWRDPVVWSIDAAGNYRWTLPIHSIGQEDAFGIHVTSDSTFLLTGEVNAVGDFNPFGSPLLLGTPIMHSQVFVAKYSVSGAGTTSIADHRDDIDILVYPNPSDNGFWVQLPMDRIGNATQVELLDAGGRLCSHQTAVDPIIRIESRDLPAGVYMLSIQTALTRTTQRVVLH